MFHAGLLYSILVTQLCSQLHIVLTTSFYFKSINSKRPFFAAQYRETGLAIYIWQREDRDDHAKYIPADKPIGCSVCIHRLPLSNVASL